MQNKTSSTQENEFYSLSDYLKIFRRQWPIILVVFLIVAGAVIYNSITTHPVYSASSVLMIESNSSQAEAIFSQRGTAQQAINNQLAYLRSRQLAEEVVYRLLESEHADSLYILGTAGSIEPNFFTKVQNLPSKGIASIAEMFSQQDTLTAMSTESEVNETDISEKPALRPVGRVAVESLNIRSMPDLSSQVRGDVVRGETIDILGQQDNWIEIETVDGIRGWVFSNYVTVDTLTPPDVEEPVDEYSDDQIMRFANRVRGSIGIEPMRSTDAIRISTESPSAVEAALIANTVAETFYEQNLEISRSEVSQTRDFVKAQLENVSRQLQQAEARVVQYQQDSEAIALDQETSNLVSRISQFQSEYDNVVIEKAATRDRIEYLKGRLSDSEQSQLNNLENITPPYVQALQDTLARAQLQLTMMRTNPDIGENHPALNSIKERIGEIQKELKASTQQMISQGVESLDPLNSSIEIFREILTSQGQIVFLEIKESQLQQLINKYNSQLETLPAKSLDMARLERDRQVKEELYLLLQRRLEETRITEAGQGGNIQIVDAAVIPNAPIRPNLQTDMMIGIVLGLGLGLGLAFVRAMLDKKIHDSEDLERMGLRVLGAVPTIEPNNNYKDLPKVSRKLIHYQDLFSPTSEAYRIIRTNLHFLNSKETGKTLLVTSPAQGEGKSLNAANLAITMARMGQRTIIVDFDLRRPMQHQLFNTDFEPGIAEVLGGELSWEETVMPTEVDNLYMISCGNLMNSPTEINNSRKVGEFISNLAESFENVLIDSPPLLAVSETSLISSLVENTLLVVKSNETNKDVLNKAQQHLQQVGGSFTGIILNDGSDKQVGYGGYYSDYKQKVPQNGASKSGLKTFTRN